MPDSATQREEMIGNIAVQKSYLLMSGAQPNNPLHGLTLEMILSRLVESIGWEAMGEAVPIRCFTHDPSISSSLKFLRKTPWARAKVESLYLETVEREERLR